MKISASHEKNSNSDPLVSDGSKFALELNETIPLEEEILINSYKRRSTSLIYASRYAQFFLFLLSLRFVACLKFVKLQQKFKKKWYIFLHLGFSNQQNIEKRKH